MSRKRAQPSKSDTPVVELPTRTKQTDNLPLPSVDDVPAASRFDAVISDNPTIEMLLTAEMKKLGIDPKTSLREFFVSYMWNMLLSGDLKRQELAARILGKGYIGEKAPVEVSEKLFIEDYEAGVKTMLGKPSTAGKKTARGSESSLEDALGGVDGDE